MDQHKEMIQVMKSSSHQGADDNLVRDLQACVNQARKAESRVKKILSDQALRAAQWDRYEKDVRTAFLSERKRHEANLEKLDAELSAALQAQEEARAKVRSAASGQRPATPAPEAGTPSPDPWADVLMNWGDEPQMGDAALRSVLERALQQPPSAVASGGHGGDMMTPPRRIFAPRTPAVHVPHFGPQGGPDCTLPDAGPGPLHQVSGTGMPFAAQGVAVAANPGPHQPSQVSGLGLAESRQGSGLHVALLCRACVCRRAMLRRVWPLLKSQVLQP